MFSNSEKLRKNSSVLDQRLKADRQKEMSKSKDAKTKAVNKIYNVFKKTKQP